jgi:hypothetical protein
VGLGPLDAEALAVAIAGLQYQQYLATKGIVVILEQRAREVDAANAEIEELDRHLGGI